MFAFTRVVNGGIRRWVGNPDKQRLSSSRECDEEGCGIRREGPPHLPSAFSTGSERKRGVLRGYGTLFSPPNPPDKFPQRNKDGLFSCSPREQAPVSQWGGAGGRGGVRGG